MSEKEQEKIDALFAGCLDGELNERERTQLKRLLLTYPSLNTELREMRRQKDLLGALPVEKAPAGLATDVRAALERNMILDPKGGRERGRWDAGLLLVRRFAALAAMLLIPIGLLSLLVFQIMRPVEQYPADPEPVGRQMEPGLPESQYSTPSAQAGDEHLANAGRLVLFTDQPILVNRFVEKRIHLHSLLNETMPVRQPEKTVYRMECSAGQLARFVSDLSGVWPRCSDARYTLAGLDPENPLVVSRIQPSQLSALLAETDAAQRRHSAGYFARLNQQSDRFHQGLPETAEETTVPPPVIAWDQAAEAGKAPVEDGPTVAFTLEVHRAGETK